MQNVLDDRSRCGMKTIYVDCRVVLTVLTGYLDLDLVQRLEFGVDHLQKNAVYQIE